MAKASIKIDDEFIFYFGKKTAGSESDSRIIPNYVKNYFIENFQKVQLKDQSVIEKIAPRFPRYIPDLNIEPFYLLEVELTFSGTKLGGILYRPDYDNSSSLSVSLIDENYDEDEEGSYLKFKISGELFWDFKPNHLKNYKVHVEKKESTWEEANLELRINFRNNPVYLKGLEYDDKGNSLPTEPEGENNLRFILKTTPNVFSVIKNYLPEKEWEKELKVWQVINQKNITFEGNYLKHFS